MFSSVFSHSIIRRALDSNKITLNIHNLRDWAKDKHKTVDDSPYGGGAGMVMKVDIIDRALKELKLKVKKNIKLKIILLTPQGKTYNQKIAKNLSSCHELLLICGHYEGFDERVRKLVDDQISVGDYVLTGGEIPAMVLIDSITRLLPDVLGKNESSQEESFSMNKLISKKLSKKLKLKICIDDRRVENCLEYPQYTRPEKYSPISKIFNKPLTVPKILLSGNHNKINNWRINQSILRSKRIK